jgi:signal transduction histidine kinase/ActR/RegA family two-component response regulator
MSDGTSRRVALGWIDPLLGWFVSGNRSSEEQRTCRLIVGFTLTVLAWSPLYAFFYLEALPPREAHVALTSLAVGMCLVAAVPLLIRFGVALGPCVALLGVNLAALMLMICSMTGGFRSPLLAWVVLLPVLGLWFGGTRMAWLWNSLVFAQLAILAAAPVIGLPVYDVLAESMTDVVWGATIVSITLTNFVLAWIYESIKHQTIQELERASQAKSDFLAHMSHEIRTPMTAILGFAEMLEGEQLSAPQQDCLRTIRRNGEHLVAVINDILDLSRVEAGRLELQPHAARPDLILREVAALIQPRAAERGLELRVDVAPETKRAIHTDATRLRQILINLAANAVKFTEAGHVRLAVFAEPDRTIRFEIEDTGPGIPEEKLGEIWKPFTQVDASMSRRYGGTGLGLAISGRLARALGGQLWVESTLGSGSIFRLRIPADPALERAEIPSRPTAARVAPVLHGRVLIAEDGPDNRRLLVHLLERWGLDVEVAENGTVAVERVAKCAERDEPIELVLMDMQMPVMDGYEAARRLRANGFQAPIVALTAHAMEGAREACLAAGCDEFLTKPVDRAQLRAVLASYLDRPSS